LDVAPSDNKANIPLVKSQSDGAIDYEVNLENYNCTCLSFPIIWYCKHICAVQIHYPKTINLVPTSALNITTAPEETDCQTPATVPHVETPTNDKNKFMRIAKIGLKLQDLANRVRFNPHVDDFDTLEELDQDLDTALSSIHLQSMLPPKKKIAPN
jgi:hypothetical protein